MAEFDLIGDSYDPRCKQNSMRPIYRKQCRNNCKYWKNNKCELGY